MEHKQYLKIVNCWAGTLNECWAVDYNSPSVGMTIKLEEVQADAEKILEKLLGMSDDVLEGVLIRHRKKEAIII